MSEIKVTHGGIEIEYHERENRWRFELRGRERFAESLAKAKEAIDKPEPKAKSAFRRVKVYKDGKRYGGGGFIAVEVTSFAEKLTYAGQQVWITYDDKQREKVSLNMLYAVTPENDALIAEIKALEKQSEELDAAIGQKRESLAHPIINAEPE